MILGIRSRLLDSSVDSDVEVDERDDRNESSEQETTPVDIKS